ncbi:porin [Piscinibacter sakaiensis]|uniref:porin n=1 Tax=Piscinibacter sakaiensis TaxID=1547922 RepID=UPI003AAE2EBB
MKPQILAASLAGIFLAPMTAQAQSNVTLFGIADAAVRYVDNQGLGSVSSLVSGSGSTSRIGFRGVEDLGGGLSAGFHLEHGLTLDDGTANSTSKFWDRRATVSVASKAIGEVRLGRDFVPSYRNWSRYDPFSYVGVARSSDFFSSSPTGPIRSAFGSNNNTTVRADNAVQYLLPKLGGIEGEVMIGLGEGGDATAGRAKLAGVRIGYATKAFGVSAASTQSENSLTTLGKFKDHVVGGNVKAGPVELSAAWRQMKYSTVKQTNLMLGAEATFGQHVVKASWHKVDMDGRVGATNVGANDATKLGLGYVYNMSKRTALYSSLARISNDGGARFAIPGGAAGLAAGTSSTGFEAGVLHRF